MDNFDTNEIQKQKDIFETKTESFTPADLSGLENEISKYEELEKENYQYLVINTRDEAMPDFDLGIEITIPKFARDKINLDPQHGPNGSTESSAIEEALSYDLSNLPENAKLATIRPDADSVGAMAVLELRKSGLNIDTDLVKAIGRADALGIKKTFEKHPEIVIRSKELTAARVKCLDKSDIKEKVIFMKKLLSNSLEWNKVEEINANHEKMKETAKQKLEISEFITNKAVMITGDHPMAFDIGYEQAGIVVAYNPNFKRPWIENDPETEKWTIARYSDEEPIDIKGLTEELNRLEKELEGTGNWGGPANLVASPQGLTSQISKDQILELVKRYIKSENYCAEHGPCHECDRHDECSDLGR